MAETYNSRPTYMEKRRPLEKLFIKELEVKFQQDQRNIRSNIAIEVFPGKNVDGYMSYDKRRPSITDNTSIEKFIETENRRRQRLDDPWQEWHTQKDGRLSKNIRHRFTTSITKGIKRK